MTATIKTWDEVRDFCLTFDKQEQDGNFWEKLFNSVDFNSDELKRFSIEIHGSNFKSTITSGYAQSIIDFQDCFYKVLKTLDTGKIPLRKPMNSTQMFFTISDGCSKIETEDLSKEMSSTVREFGKLGTKGQLILAFVVTAYIASSGINEYFSNKFEYLEKVDLTKIQLEDKESERKNLQQLLSSDKFKIALDYAKESNKSIRKSFIKNTPASEVDFIKFPSETLSKAQIINEQQKGHTEKRAEIESYDFKVLNLSGSFSTKKLRAKVQLVNDPETEVTLTSALFDEEYDSEIDSVDEYSLQESDIDVLWNAQKHNKPVRIWGNFVYDQNNKLMKGVIWTVTAVE